VAGFFICIFYLTPTSINVFNKSERKSMLSNIGGIDRILRLLIGLALVSLVFIGPKTPWGWLGLIPLATGICRVCPAYLPFKFTTKKEEKQ
jgi:hypothetical protein